jgi:hypothetical protein
MRLLHDFHALARLARTDSLCHMDRVSETSNPDMGSIMARRAKSVSVRSFSFLLAAPFAAVGEVLSSVIATNRKVPASR